MASSAPSAPLGVKRFEWCIDRSEFGKKGLCGGSTKSSSFSCGLGSSWHLKLREDSWSGYSLYLVPDSKNPSCVDVDIKFKFGVILKDGTEAHVKRGQIISGTGIDACILGYPKFLYGVNFYYEDDEYFRNDDDGEGGELTIFCDHEIVRKCNLSLDFGRMFDSGKFTDFTFVVGDEELKVHRAVLASRCPVFEALFEQNSKEGQTGRVEIKDLTVVGMKGLLEFIYSGKVKGLKKIAIAVQVLPAAEKYEVDELKTLCEKAICKKFLDITNLHSSEYLITDALEFIKESAAEVADEGGFYALVNAFEEIAKSFSGKRVDESGVIEPEEKRIKLN